MDEDYFQKNTITRSYSRKINLGNYESADFFASQTIIAPNDISLVEYHELSEDLFAQVKAEVELQIAKVKPDLNGDDEAFKRVLQNTSQFKSASMEDFQKLSPFQASIVNELKKAYKRSPEYKELKGNNSVENEQNRK